MSGCFHLRGAWLQGFKACGRVLSAAQARARPEPMQHAQRRPLTGAQTVAREARNKTTVALCCVRGVVSFAFTRHVFQKSPGTERD